jgi:ADP-ribose pyrophosphatase
MLHGGMIERAEQAVAAAQRDLLEETGNMASEWEHLGGFVPNSYHGCGKAHIFLARNVKPVAELDPIHDLESTQLFLRNLDDALRAAFNGEIGAMGTAAAIGLIRQRLTSESKAKRDV